MDTPSADGPASSIPAPGPRYATRIGIPATVACVVAGLVIASAWDTLAPATTVRVVPAVFEREVIPATDPATQAPPASTRSVQAPGWLEAEPFAVACTALADGVVAEIHVLEGQPVAPSQIIATLVPEDAQLSLARADAELRIAEATLAVAQADLRAAQTEWNEPVERRRAVAATSAQLAETEASLAQLPSLIATERAALDRLIEEHKRVKNALESGAINEIEEIISRKRVDEQQAKLDSVERSRGILEAQRDRLAAEAAAADRNADLRIAERRALDAAVASAAVAEAAVAEATARRDEASLRLERMTIRAPIAGYVQRRLKAPGDKVMLGGDDPTSAQIALIYDPNRLQVRVDVPLADAAAVRPGQPCEVVVDVLPDRVFRGEVLRFTSEADIQKNTVQIKVRVLDPDPLLRPEMLTRVKFLGSDAVEGAHRDAQTDGTAVVRIPTSTLRATGAGSSEVWVVRERRRDIGTAHRITVVPEDELDGWTRIRSTVRPGDLIALNAEHLRDGARVRIVGAHRGGSS